MSSIRVTLVWLGVLLIACSSNHDQQGGATPTADVVKGCEECTCHSNGQCAQGLACDDEHFESPGTCVPEVPYVDCFSVSGSERCACQVEQGAPTDHPSTDGCGDLPAPWGGDGDYLCCTGESWPDDGVCFCDKLPSPGAFTCADYADLPHEVSECKKGPFTGQRLPPVSGGGGAIGGSGGTGGSGSTACDPSSCRGSTDCTEYGCVTCSKHCSKDGCVDDGCSDIF